MVVAANGSGFSPGAMKYSKIDSGNDCTTVLIH